MPTPSTKPPDPARAGSWRAARLRVELDASEQWRRRAVRAIRGRRAVRLEVVVPKLEVELVKMALERRGWRFVTSVPVGPPAAHLDGRADDPTIVLFTSTVRAESTSRTAVRMGYRADAALHDAGVRGLESVAIDASKPSGDHVERWSPAAPVGSATGALPEAAAVHIFGAEDAAGTAWDRARPRAGWPDAGIERQPRAGQRLADAWRDLKDSDFRFEPPAANIGRFLLAFVGSFVVSQVVAHASAKGRARTAVVWAHVPVLRWTVVVAAVVLVLAGSLAWWQAQGLAHQRHGGTDDEGRDAYREAARRSILSISGDLRPPYRQLVGLSAVCLGLTAGIGIGTMSLFPISQVPGVFAGLILLGVVRCLWDVARQLWRGRRFLFRGLSVVTVVAAVAPFGQFCWYLFYAGLGRSADEVDIAPVDAIVVGAVALALPLFLAALAVGLAAVLDRHARLPAVVVLAVFMVAALGLLNGNLVEARRTGRRLAMGLPTRAVSGLRTVPGPKARCLAWVSPDATMKAGPLPLFVWEIGASHDQLLLVVPGEALAGHPLRPGADPATYSPAHDLQAPVQTVGREEVRFAPVKAGDTC